MFDSSFTDRPVIVPSRRAVSVMSWITSRPWCAETIASERVSVYLTGLPTRSAARNVISSSGVTWSLPPNPPPTSGAITRILCSGTPVTSASISRRMCGIWVADHIVHSPAPGSTTMLRGSMNEGIRRCWTYRRWMVTSASAALTELPVPISAESRTQVYALLVPLSECTSEAPSASASSMSRTTGNGSYSTSTPSSASTALARSRATTTATASPTCRTSSTASAGWLGCTMSSVTGQAHGRLPCRSATSAPVNAAITFGAASAPETSIRLIWACACGLRRIARCSITGRVTLSVHRVRPVSSRASSLRSRARPTSPAQVSGKALTDLGLAGVRVLPQQVDGCHDHTGSTEAALQRVVGVEGPLHRVQLAVLTGQPFDGGDRAAIDLDGEHGTALDRDRATIGSGHQDRACAAVAGITAHHRADLAAAISQVMDEKCSGFDIVDVSSAVDGDADASHSASRSYRQGQPAADAHGPPQPANRVDPPGTRPLSADAGSYPWWMRPSSSDRRAPPPPHRVAMISAAMLTAVSSGVRAPRSSPIGEESRLRASSSTPASRSRASRSSCVRREPIAPT